MTYLTFMTSYSIFIAKNNKLQANVYIELQRKIAGCG